MEFLKTKGVLLQKHFVILHLLVEFALGERKRVGVKKCNYNNNKLNTVLILFDLFVVLGCLIYF